MSSGENGSGSGGSDAQRPPRGARASARVQLVAAISGLLLTVAFLYGSFTPEGPTVGSATADEVRAFAAENATALRAAALAGICVLLLVVVFAAALAQFVRLHSSTSMLPGLIAAGGILIGIYVWLDTAAQTMTVVLPELIDTNLVKVDDSTLLGWYGLTAYTHYLGDLVMAPIVLMVGAFSIAVLTHRLLPRWLGWLGVAVAASGAVGVVGIATGTLLWAFWFGGLLGWVLWIPLVSVTLGLRWRRLRRL